MENIFEQGGEINPSDDEGDTPLHIAAQEGYLNVCQAIMKQLIDKNPRDYDGITPLHLAAEEGHFQICKFILEKVSDKNPGDDNNQTPLHYAAGEGHGQICKLILDNVEDKNPGDNFGETPGNLHVEAFKEVNEIFHWPVSNNIQGIDIVRQYPNFFEKCYATFICLTSCCCSGSEKNTKKTSSNF